MMSAAAAFLLLTAILVEANDNGLALTPPLGWRSWNLFAADVNQTLIEKIMRAMIDRSRSDHAGRPTSLCDLGYCDVGLDDAWQACQSPEAAEGMNYHREDGSPIVNLKRFPDLKGMVDLAHSLNLTAGWYGNNCICQDACRNPEECEKQIEGDVKAIVEFGFDAWKLDGCGGETNLPLFDEYIRKLSSKPILVENCHWGDPGILYSKPDQTLPPSKGCLWNFYRSSYDIGQTYGSMMHNLGSVELFRSQNLSYPGCWAYHRCKPGVRGRFWWCV
uniref:Alpha-galactosidase n=1 Tax=Odontella aurita TaxID=265563 RepID=A0A6U6FDI2_9STRA|mmetsp:Transcript_3428/g.8930  ORF Transcript_3428/g.8930 Transcript_3428/m.8930 type:complete len:275 (+) Transcript_3428:128-952(+)